MTDHAGGRRSVANLGTKVWRRPVKVTQTIMMINLIFFWSYKRAPKPLLGRQNLVTSTGGRHNLVPWLTT